MAHAFGYARISTTDQDAQLQHDALTAAGCYRIFTDTASGALQSRPELDKLLDQLRPGDTLVVWRLDRLGRSIRHLIDQLSDLQDSGIEFRSLQENIDTTSPRRPTGLSHLCLPGRVRTRPHPRTHQRRPRRRPSTRTGWWPPTITNRRQTGHRQKNSTTKQDLTVAQIGNILGVSRSTIYRALKSDPGFTPSQRQRTIKPQQ